MRQASVSPTTERGDVLSFASWCVSDPLLLVVASRRLEYLTSIVIEWPKTAARVADAEKVDEAQGITEGSRPLTPNFLRT